MLMPATINAAQNTNASRLVRRVETWNNIATQRSARRIRSPRPGGIDGKPGIITDRAVVVIETETEETLLPFGVTCPGVTLQTESAGAPLQDSDTCWLNPPSGVTASVKFVAWPAFSVEDPEEIDTEKSIPVPVRVSNCVLGEALSVTDSDPDRVPPAVGLKVTLMEQFAPAAKLAPQVLVWLKSPLTLIPEMFSAALPPLLSFTA